ncbi:hypothetical protein [Bradyrhizobium sp.]|uniref:hypothetical protein n=1 Tax=Bradyrhizobium sp. TaxID=376 RepID=UPI0040376B30
MQRIEIDPAIAGPPARAACPECSAGLTVLKIIPGRVGRGGCEYWTMRCTRCGNIHLDIVEPAGAPAA